MPNMFGGDQFHPAYDCRTELRPDQVLLGNRLFTARPDGLADWEDVDGTTGVCHLPKELTEKLAKGS
jgi:hypothetical protein